MKSKTVILRQKGNTKGSKDLEELIARFSATLPNDKRIFYFETFKEWCIAEFGDYSVELGNRVLSLDCIIELGCDAYQLMVEQHEI